MDIMLPEMEGDISNVPSPRWDDMKKKVRKK
jgi:hypothetical protein